MCLRSTIGGFAVVAAWMACLQGCSGPADRPPTAPAAERSAALDGRVSGESASLEEEEPPPEWFAEQRDEMIRRQLRADYPDLAREGIRDPRVLEAFAAVAREEFVPREYRRDAYGDHPLPIGHGQTISQPYMVAVMTEKAEIQPDDTVLEVGTGSGYQAAILAQMGAKVYTIEILEPLGLEARERLERLGYDDVEVRIGDGYAGWPEHAPFDAIIVTAAPEEVPKPLVEQLKPGGRLLIPVGPRQGVQWLHRYTKSPEGGLREERLMGVRFVPFLRDDRNPSPDG